MEPLTLAAAAVAILKPYVAEAGKAAAAEVGGALPGRVRKLWDTLWAKLKQREASKEAADDFVKHPADEDTEASLRRQVRKILEEDSRLADGVGTLVEQIHAGGDVILSTVRESVLAPKSGIVIHGGKGGVHIRIELNQRGEFLRDITGTKTPSEDLKDTAEKYLQYLVDRYRYLDFRGLGVSDRVPLRLALQDLYVPLKASGQFPLSGGSDRQQAKLAGRRLAEGRQGEIGEHPAQPVDLAELLEKAGCLIILGDPGAGKTTFLKLMALHHATAASPETRLPLLVPLSAYANMLAERDVRLDDFVAEYLYTLGSDLKIEPMVKDALQAGRALVMLDGLDEVKDVSCRDTVVRRVVEFYTHHCDTGNKFVITSRIIGYGEVRPAAEGLVECTLLDFGDEDIEEFITRWTLAIEKGASGDTSVVAQEADRERRELMDAVRRNPGVRKLAANPLLLTILALMKRQGMTLPERRVELYAKYVEVLVSSWNRARGLDRASAPDLVPGETIRTLAPLALWMHEVNPGVGLVRRNRLVERLRTIYTERGEAAPEEAAARFLRDVGQYTGILLERGHGEYGFIHLTFEEYLAAIALAERAQQDVKPLISALESRLGDSAWQEVSLLAIDYLGLVQRRYEAATAVVRGLLSSGAGKPGEAAVLAGDAVCDLWPDGVTAEGRGKAVDRLLEIMRDDRTVGPTVRVEAGDTLARLGDPRFTAHAAYLPDEDLLGFIEVPAGRFKMGEGSEEHEVTLATYYIARYPVTNDQFRAFVGVGGYQDEKYWTEGHEAGVWRDGFAKCDWDETPRRGAYDFGEPFNLANHPVVGVTWYEAVAYCKWLSERLQDWDQGLARALRAEKLHITLPSEAQWEKAARSSDSRTYPWGDESDRNRANCEDTGIGTTSAVGCFPGGASPYGCEDMSGNVWEWTRSLYREYPYKPRPDREDFGAGTHVPWVLRGGSFIHSQRRVRCAYRSRNFPGDHSTRVGFRVVASPLSL